MSDTQKISGLDTLELQTGSSRKLGQALVHLFDCVAKIRTHVGRVTLLDTGAIEATFGLIDVLNTDKKRGGLERGCKIKEAACYALWSILEDFPEGQAACYRWKTPARRIMLFLSPTAVQPCLTEHPTDHRADGLRILVACLSLLNRAPVGASRQHGLEVSCSGALCNAIAPPPPDGAAGAGAAAQLLSADGHRILLAALDDPRAHPRARTNAAAALRGLLAAGGGAAQRRVLSAGGATILLAFLHVGGADPIAALLLRPPSVRASIPRPPN